MVSLLPLNGQVCGDKTERNIMPKWLPRTDEESERWWKEKDLEDYEESEKRNKHRRSLDTHSIGRTNPLKSYFDGVAAKHDIY